MPIVERFSAPGHVALHDSHMDAWSDVVSAIFEQFTGTFPQFYNPTKVDTPGDAQRVSIGWRAFPASLLPHVTSQEQRWEIADGNRLVQDEYCEWSVARDEHERILRVTFTSEMPEFWGHVAQRDPDALVELYRTFVDTKVDASQLFKDGEYVPNNPFNNTTTGRLAHLIQRNNNLDAAVRLAAEATVPRRNADGPVTHKQALVICGGLGNAMRNSDPTIAVAVNDAARRGAEITLADPTGLYIDGLTTTGMVTPDGTDPETFWTVERGEPTHAVRTSFSVPDHLPYGIEDITVNGRPIRFGAQLADRVRVRLDAIIKTGDHVPAPIDCVS